MIYSTRASSSETVRRIGRAEAVTILQKSSDKAGDLRRAIELVEERAEEITEMWHQYH